jgi:hypothetical protein
MMTRALLLLLALTVPALAHSWYPPHCCSDQDCQPVKCEDISETPDGFVYERNGGGAFPRRSPAKWRPQPSGRRYV